MHADQLVPVIPLPPQPTTNAKPESESKDNVDIEEKLSKEIDTLKQRCDEVTNERDTLRKTLVTTQAAAEDTERSLGRAKELLKEEQARSEALKVERDRAQSTAATHEETALAERRKAVLVSEKLELLQVRHQRCADEIQGLKDKVSEWKKVAEDEETKMSACKKTLQVEKERYEVTMHTLKMKEEEVKEKVKELERALEAIEEKEDEISRLKCETDNRGREGSILEQERQILNERVNEAERQRQALLGRVSTLESKLNEVEKERDSARRDAEASQRHLQRLKEDKESDEVEASGRLSRAVKAGEEKVIAVKEELERVNTMHKAEIARIQEKERQLRTAWTDDVARVQAEWATRLVVLEKEIKLSKERVHDLEDELKRTQQKLNEEERKRGERDAETIPISEHVCYMIHSFYSFVCLFYYVKMVLDFLPSLSFLFLSTSYYLIVLSPSRLSFLRQPKAKQKHSYLRLRLGMIRYVFLIFVISLCYEYGYAHCLGSVLNIFLRLPFIVFLPSLLFFY